MIDYIEATIPGVFPPIGKLLAVSQPSGHTTSGFTADNYKLFGDGADYRLHLKNLKTGGQELDIRFCPPKILQGHNGLGSNDLRGVVLHSVLQIFKDRGIPLVREVKKRLRDGDYTLREVHIAELHSMPHASIPALCRAIRQRGPDSLQAVPLQRGIGVRLWPNSRSRQVLIYDKVHYFNDVNGRNPFKHYDILRAGISSDSHAYHWQALNMQDLMDYLRQGVRIEVRLMAQFLRQRKLDRGDAWTKEIAQQVRQGVLDEVPLGSAPLASVVDQAITTASLPQKSLLLAWAAGRDPCDFATSRAAYYRHCKAIKSAYGLDISRPLLQVAGAITWGDLIDWGAIVERAPKWARGDGFFFNPGYSHRAVVTHRGEGH